MAVRGRAPEQVVGLLPIALLLMVLAGCAPTVYRNRASLLEEMEIRLRNGQIGDARVLAHRICDSAAGTEEAAIARYRLGCLNVFYMNPSPDPRLAIHDFSRFVVDNPDHRLAVDAKSWITVLGRLDSLEREGRSCAARLRAALFDTVWCGARADSMAQECAAVLEESRRTALERDSLAARVRLLEEVIDTIEMGR